LATYHLTGCVLSREFRGLTRTNYVLGCCHYASADSPGFQLIHNGAMKEEKEGKKNEKRILGKSHRSCLYPPLCPY
jgi:hypothetical protein